jgi:hypothetical protein
LTSINTGHRLSRHQFDLSCCLSRIAFLQPQSQLPGWAGVLLDEVPDALKISAPLAWAILVPPSGRDEAPASRRSARPAQNPPDCEVVHTARAQFALIRSLQIFWGFNRTGGFRMKGLIISLSVVAALVAAMTAIPRSHSVATIGTEGTLALQNMEGARSVDKLPVGDFDDRSLVFPRETNR